MNKLFVFGDSFAGLSDNPPEWAWQVDLARRLKLDLYNISHNGASAEWLTLKIIEFYDKIEEGDIVIALLPFWNRVCIWPEDPDFTHVYQYREDDPRWQKKTNKEIQAYKDYFYFLYNKELTMAKMYSYCAWIDKLSHRLKHKPLLIYTREFNKFKNLPIENCAEATGNLFAKSVLEFENEKIWDELTKDGGFRDPRLSHLCKPNHATLADKIYNYYSKNEVVNLNKDFKTGFLNQYNFEEDNEQIR